MRKFAAFTCAAAMLGLFSITTDSVVSQAEAKSRKEICHRKAARRANRARRPGEAALGSAIGSAALGAIIGGMINGGKGATRGAIIGGTAGALGGASLSLAQREEIYALEFDRCMGGYRWSRARLKSRWSYARSTPRWSHARPEPWTNEWYDYCRRKFRSFNPRTGRYLAYSGRYRLCR